MWGDHALCEKKPREGGLIHYYSKKAGFAIPNTAMNGDRGDIAIGDIAFSLLPLSLRHYSSLPAAASNMSMHAYMECSRGTAMMIQLMVQRRGSWGTAMMTASTDDEVN